MTTELEKANAVVADLERKRQSVVDHYDKLANERAAITGSWSVRSGRMALISFSAKRGSRRSNRRFQAKSSRVRLNKGKGDMRSGYPQRRSGFHAESSCVEFRGIYRRRHTRKDTCVSFAKQSVLPAVQ